MKVAEGFNKDITNKLDSLRLIFKKQTGGVSGGARRSREKGSSNEFSDFRTYTYGDSLRFVDWNSYARLDKLFVKLYMEEKQSVVNVFLDNSASMDFYEKYYMSGMIATALMYTAVGGGDRANLHLGKESFSLGAKNKLTALIDFIDNKPCEGEINLSEAIKAIPISYRGKYIIISDFMMPVAAINEALKYLAYKKQEVTLVMVNSLKEVNPPIEDSLTLKDSETKEDIYVEADQRTIEAYQKAYKAHKSAVINLCLKQGADFAYINSEDNITMVLGKLLSKY